MMRISRNIVVLAGVLMVVVFLAIRTKVVFSEQAESPTISADTKQEVLAEAVMVQVSAETLERLRIKPNMKPSSKVTISFPVLLYVLADPNSAKTITSAKVKVWAGETGKVKIGQNIKYLIKTDEGSFEQKTTDTFFGTTFEATPAIDKDGDILLNFKFEYLEAVPPKEVDPQTSLPIGEPTQIATTTLNTRVKVKSGEPTIVSSSPQQFVLVRANIDDR
jgi:hypothetical protein